MTISSIEIDEHLIKRFFIAARKGDVSTVEEALRTRVPVDIIVDEFDWLLFDWFGLTALMYAAQFNMTDIIRLLLQNKADENKRNRNGETAVHCAARKNNPEAIVLLVKHGASINITNSYGNKPIDLPRQNKCETAVHMLEQL